MNLPDKLLGATYQETIANIVDAGDEPAIKLVFYDNRARFNSFANKKAKTFLKRAFRSPKDRAEESRKKSINKSKTGWPSIDIGSLVIGAITIPVIVIATDWVMSFFGKGFLQGGL